MTAEELRELVREKLSGWMGEDRYRRLLAWRMESDANEAAYEAELLRQRRREREEQTQRDWTQMEGKWIRRV